MIQFGRRGEARSRSSEEAEWNRLWKRALRDEEECSEEEEEVEVGRDAEEAEG